MAHLTGGRIDVNVLREEARRELVACLKKYEGSKAIVWDDQLVGPFGLLADYPYLKNHGVTQMFQLRAGKLPTVTADHVVYLIRPKLSLMGILADNIFKEETKDKKNKLHKYKFHILFMPRGSLICEKKLVDLGVFGNFESTNEFQVELFPIDCDVISMESPTAFSDCYIDNDMTSMFHVATALMKLQAMFGVIPKLYGQGKAAKHVVDLITRMRLELGDKGPKVAPQIDALLLIDRSVDLITPLVTQLTYEGLLDEIYGINNNHVKLPPEKFAQASDAPSNEPLTELKQFTLTSSEEIFACLRDKNFNAVGSVIKRTVQSLSAVVEEKDKAKSVQDLKEFVTKIPYIQAQKKSVANHTLIAELIKEVIDKEVFRETIQVEQEFLNVQETDKVNPFIEECIAKEEELSKVLRLVCLQSLTNNGLKPKVLDFYKREIIQTYGYKHMITLHNLEKVGLLKLSVPATSYLTTGLGKGYNYNALRKTLRLNAEVINEQNPTDITYVYSGYAPASVRLAQFLVSPGWRAITSLLRSLPEPTVEEIQQIPISHRARRSSDSSSHSDVPVDGKTILVFFLGGCTFAEISALRFLTKSPEINASFVIATTKLINGKTFLNSLSETLGSDAPSL